MGGGQREELKRGTGHGRQSGATVGETVGGASSDLDVQAMGPPLPRLGNDRF